MRIIDLFSGCGGLSLGFIKDGHIIEKAVEFDPLIANTYKLNHPNVNVLVDDIKNIDTSNIFTKGSADIIIGGPPCQGFSMAGARIRNGFIDDSRNYLFKHYFNIVKKVQPKVFIMENVKGIKTMQNGKIFKEIIRIFSDESMLESQPYSLYHRIVKATDFGIPQKRERMIIIGVKKNNPNFESIWNTTIEEIKELIPSYFDKATVEDAIGNLPDPSNDGIVNNPRPISTYQHYLQSDADFLYNHVKTNHSQVAIERMRQIANGQNFTSLNDDIKSVHSGSYGRLRWNDFAPTITTRFDTPSGGRFIHPSHDRTLTPREAARIQSFPDDFIFYGNKTSICKQIGNAVPPKISFFLSRFVKNLFEKEN